MHHEWDYNEERNAFHEPKRTVREPHRAILFHTAALLDVNYCGLDILRWTEEENEAYVVLEKAVLREAIELDGELAKDKEMMFVI